MFVMSIFFYCLQTIKVNIIRDASATYSDTTLEADKNYSGAIQTYEYGTVHETGLTISKGSAITLQYDRKVTAATPVLYPIPKNKRIIKYK